MSPGATAALVVALLVALAAVLGAVLYRRRKRDGRSRHIGGQPSVNLDSVIGSVEAELGHGPSAGPQPAPREQLPLKNASQKNPAYRPDAPLRLAVLPPSSFAPLVLENGAVADTANTFADTAI